MAVKFYSFGTLVGGINDLGEPVQLGAVPVGPPQVFTGILAVGDTVLTFDSATQAIQVICTHDSAGFTVSVDGGLNWIALAAYGQLNLSMQIDSLIIRSADISSYTVIATLSA